MKFQKASFLSVLLGSILFSAVFAESVENSDAPQFFIFESREFPGFHLSVRRKDMHHGSLNNHWTGVDCYNNGSKGGGAWGLQRHFRIKLVKDGCFVPLEEELAFLREENLNLKMRILKLEEIIGLSYEK